MSYLWTYDGAADLSQSSVSLGTSTAKDLYVSPYTLGLTAGSSYIFTLTATLGGVIVVPVEVSHPHITLVILTSSSPNPHRILT